MEEGLPTTKISYESENDLKKLTTVAVVTIDVYRTAKARKITRLKLKQT